tara:strand:- start:521 stop:724 length:204 start_codon:yes stop_codon:yes gene_type:complete
VVVVEVDPVHIMAEAQVVALVVIENSLLNLYQLLLFQLLLEVVLLVVVEDLVLLMELIQFLETQQIP